MTFIEWIKGHLNLHPHQNGFERASAKADEAIESTEAVITEARTMKDNLQPYLSAHDPFTALIADLHNRREVIRQIAK